MKRTGPTPEGAAQKAIIEYLTVCRLGKVKRNNVGQTRMGNAPTHPWQKDTRRVVRFGQVGEADLSIELTGSPRVIYIEVKAPNWRAPKVPQALCSPSTLKAYRHHTDQVAFLDGQRKRGNVAFFARSPLEVYNHLTAAGFLGLPVPQETPKPVVRSLATQKTVQKPLGSKK